MLDFTCIFIDEWKPWGGGGGLWAIPKGSGTTWNLGTYFVYFWTSTRRSLQVGLREAPNRAQIPALQAILPWLFGGRSKEPGDACWDGAGQALSCLAVGSEVLAMAQPTFDSLFRLPQPSFPPSTWNRSALYALA